MVFHLLLKLHRHQYDSYPQALSPSEAYVGEHHDHMTVGIGCGPAGNNCSVEGSGQRGPGPMPLPVSVRAIFKYGSGARGVGSTSGSLYDLRAARTAIRASGDSGYSAGASHPPPLQHGFGSSAYSAAQTPMFSLSTVRIPHVAGSSSSSSGGPSHSHSSFFGILPKPRPTTEVSAVWGGSGKEHSATQFTSFASMLPQSSNSTFHMSYSGGVVDPTSVEVRDGSGNSGGSSVGHFSWNSAKLMDRQYHLLVGPKTMSVSKAWQRTAPSGQFSSASMLPQSTHSSFHFALKNGVVDMRSVVATSHHNTGSSWQGSGRGQQYGIHEGSGRGQQFGIHGRAAANEGSEYMGAAMNSGAYWRSNSGATAHSGAHQSLGPGSSGNATGHGAYSWSTRRAKYDGSGAGDWVIAPQPPQWLPEGVGTDLGL